MAYSNNEVVNFAGKSYASVQTSSPNMVVDDTSLNAACESIKLRRLPIPYCPCTLSFDFVKEVKIYLIEMMHSNITVFSSTGVSAALRVCSDVIQRSEMTLHSPNFILEDLMVEPCLELSLSRRSRSDICCRLATSKNNEIFLCSDGSRIQRCISRICLE